jgi:beta-carotene 3-hydroxylase
MLPLWAHFMIAVGVFLLMEGVAWATHKYVMHGFLWSWHKSHHSPYTGVLEKNDLFGVVFSIPAIVTWVVGASLPSMAYLLSVGVGITGYGIFYVLFHDVLVHRRLKHNMRPQDRYLKRMIRAHKIHHKVTTKEGAEAFGFLYAPARYEASTYTQRTASHGDHV